MSAHASKPTLTLEQFSEASLPDMFLVLLTQVDNVLTRADELRRIRPELIRLGHLFKRNKLHTIRSAATLLNVLPATVYDAIKRGRLTATRIKGGPLVVTEFSCLEYMRTRNNKGGGRKPYRHLLG